MQWRTRLSPAIVSHATGQGVATRSFFNGSDGLGTAVIPTRLSLIATNLGAVNDEETIRSEMMALSRPNTAHELRAGYTQRTTERRAALPHLADRVCKRRDASRAGSHQADQ